MSEQTCFVISPIGEEKSETRENADLVLKHIIRPAVSEAGFKVERADEIDKSGIITNQIIQYVLESDLVVADLSGRNPNVFYELALRHAARKPLIQIIRKGEELPFDVAAMRTIRYDLDLEGAEKAKSEISSYIASLTGAKEVESPVSMAIDVYKSSSADGSVEAQVTKIRNETGQILGELQNLQSSSAMYDLDDIATKIDTLSSVVSELEIVDPSPTFSIVEGYITGHKAARKYPDAVVLAHIANLVAPDLPVLAEKLRQCIEDSDNSVKQSVALELIDAFKDVLSELDDRKLPQNTRLYRNIDFARQCLEKVTEDYIPF